MSSSSSKNYFRLDSTFSLTDAHKMVENVLQCHGNKIWSWKVTLRQPMHHHDKSTTWLNILAAVVMNMPTLNVTLSLLNIINLYRSHLYSVNEDYYDTWGSVLLPIQAVLTLTTLFFPFNHTVLLMPKIPSKHFYKVRSVGSHNNSKQSWCISCSHQSYLDQSLSPGPAPISHESHYHTLGMKPPGMLGNEGWRGASRYQITSHVGKGDVMWSCVCVFVYIYM